MGSSIQRRRLIVFAIAALCIVFQYIHPSSGDWPMFRHDRPHTGRSSSYAVECGGAVLWTYTAGGDIISSPAQASDGTVYIGSDDNVFYALSPDGEIEWSYASGDDVSSSPAISATQEVYVGSEDNQFYAFNSTGCLKWSYTHPGGGAEDQWESSPAIDATGGVYLQARKSLVAFDSDGRLAWSFRTGAASVAHSSSPAIDGNGRIFLGTGDVDRLYAVDSNDTLAWSYLTGGTLQSSPAVGSDGSVYIGCYDNNVYAYTSAGALAWSYQTGADVYSSPAIDASGSVYVGSRDNNLYTFAEGALSWSYLAGMNVDSSPAIDATGVVYVGAQDKKLYSFNSDGTLSGSYEAGGWFDSSPAIGLDSKVYVGSHDNTVYAICTAVPTATPDPNLPIVLISEILYDPDGDDNGHSFIELVGFAGRDISGWKIVGIDGDDGSIDEQFTFPQGSVFPDDGEGLGLLVVADEVDGVTYVSNYDFTDPDMDLSNGPDNVRIVDNYGRITDALAYDSVTPGDNGNFAVFAGEGTAMGSSGEGYSLVRYPALFDTGDNAYDFIVDSPSPGYAEGLGPTPIPTPTPSPTITSTPTITPTQQITSTPTITPTPIWSPTPGTSPYPVIEQTDLEDGIQLDVTLGGLYQRNVVENNEEFIEILLSDAGSTQDIGKPKLPAIRRLVMVPLEAEPSIDVLEDTYTDVPISNRVFPVQREGFIGGPEMPFEIDEVFYSTWDDFYPELPASLVSGGMLRDVRVFNVEICPIRYNPATDTLRISSYLSIRINYGDNGESAGEDTEKSEWLKYGTTGLSDAYIPMYRSLVVNYDSLGLPDGDSQEKNSSEGGTVTTFDDPYESSNGCDYLIVVHDAFYDSILPLAGFRANHNDFNVGIVKTSSIYSSEVQLTCFRELYELLVFIMGDTGWATPKPSYLLLVGDDAEIPPAYFVGTYCDSEGAPQPTDYLYACVVGTSGIIKYWSEGDQCTTTPMSYPGDYSPDIVVGRMSASSVLDVERQVTKVINNDRAPDPYGTSWTNKAVLGAASDGGPPIFPFREVCEAKYRNFFSPAGISTTKLYAEPAGDVEEEMTAAINSGVNFVFSYSHGWPGGWAGVFHISKVPYLNNRLSPIGAFVAACETSPINVEDCINEMLNEEPDGGSSNVMGSAALTCGEHANRIGGAYLQTILGRKFESPVKTEYPDYLMVTEMKPPMREVGRALTKAKSAFFTFYGSLPDGWHVKEALEEYNLLGDPAMHVWLGETPPACTPLPTILDLQLENGPVFVRGDRVDLTASVDPGTNGLKPVDLYVRVTGPNSYTAYLTDYGDLVPDPPVSYNSNPLEMTFTQIPLSVIVPMNAAEGDYTFWAVFVDAGMPLNSGYYLCSPDEVQVTVNNASPPTPTPPVTLIINEVHYEGDPNNNNEGIEVYNYGSSTTILDEWWRVVESKNNGQVASFDIVPADRNIGPGAYKVFCNEGEPGNYEIRLNDNGDWVGIGHLIPGRSGKYRSDYDRWACGAYWGNTSNPPPPQGFVRINDRCGDNQSSSRCPDGRVVGYVFSKESPTKGYANACQNPSINFTGSCISWPPGNPSHVRLYPRLGINPGFAKWRRVRPGLYACLTQFGGNKVSWGPCWTTGEYDFTLSDNYELRTLPCVQTDNARTLDACAGLRFVHSELEDVYSNMHIGSCVPVTTPPPSGCPFDWESVCQSQPGCEDNDPCYPGGFESVPGEIGPVQQSWAKAAITIRVPVGSYPWDLAAGDLNNDGKIDLAVGNGFGSDGISILLGNGDGTFADQIGYGSCNNPGKVAISDLNNDGKPDLAVANWSSSNRAVCVHLNMGDAVFSPPASYTVEYEPMSVASGDFNGDDKMDLAVTETGISDNFGSSVSVLLGKGDGSFNSPVQYGVGHAPTSVVSADFNGDGNLDLAATNNMWSQDISVLLGKGDGTFGPDVRYGAGKQPMYIVSADFNGDGKMDIATSNYERVGEESYGTVSVLIGKGDGMFEGEVRYRCSQFAEALTTTDWNLDGKTDLAVVDPDSHSNSVSIMLGNGDGAFSSQLKYAVGRYPAGIISADFNGDGKLDLAVVNNMDHDVSILINDNTPGQVITVTPIAPMPTPTPTPLPIELWVSNDVIQPGDAFRLEAFINRRFSTSPFSGPYDVYVVAMTPKGNFSVNTKGEWKRGVHPIMSDVEELDPLGATLLDVKHVPRGFAGEYTFIAAIVRHADPPRDENAGFMDKKRVHVRSQ